MADQHQLYARNVAHGLDEAMADTPVVAIVGPRQCGKSTLAEQLIESRSGGAYVTLDDAARRAAARADPTGFVESAELPLAIDEFQKAPALLDAIKLRVDRARRGGRRPAGMFLLTGSANVWATLGISESLTGRAERIQLWPLSQGELEGRRERFLEGLLAGRAPEVSGCRVGRAAVAERVVAGGYPEMLARTEGRRARWARNYVDMIVERDVRDLVEHAQYLDELPRLLDLGAARVGGLLDLTAMGSAIGMKRDTVRRYLTLLELLYLVRRVPAWSRNLGQRQIRSPKLWMPDTGLACELLGYSREQFMSDETALAGALFENFVAGEVLKQAGWCDTAVRVHHFRTAGGREVDILVEASDGRVAGIEVKLGASPSKADFSGLAYLRDKLGDRFTAGVVIGTGTETLPFGDRLWSVPAAGLWAG